MYYVYILASIQRTLYIGFTGDLHRRLHQHKTGAIHGFTSRYRVNRLVHLETFTDVRDAKAREHQLKGWVRKKKIALIQADNRSGMTSRTGSFPLPRGHVWAATVLRRTVRGRAGEILRSRPEFRVRAGFSVGAPSGNQHFGYGEWAFRT